MIYILDDSFDKTILRSDTSFIENYKDKILLLDENQSYKSNILSIANKINNKDCLCIHKSLIIKDAESNEEFKLSIETIAKEKKIPVLTFSRGVNSNIDAKTIDKIQFYKNLRFFADKSEPGNYEIKALYYGENYLMMHRMDLANKIISTIYTTEDINSLVCDENMTSWIEDFTGNNPAELLKDWASKTKKEIRKIINELV